MTIISISIFAVLGALTRYYQSNFVASLLGKSFPYATLSINILGSFLMGFLFFFTLERIATPPSLRAGLLTGFLGAYTTFSTFSLETYSLFQDGRPAKALVYSLGSVTLGLAAVFLGAAMGRR